MNFAFRLNNIASNSIATVDIINERARNVEKIWKFPSEMLTLLKLFLHTTIR
jgi:hypothetical protein